MKQSPISWNGSYHSTEDVNYKSNPGSAMRAYDSDEIMLVAFAVVGVFWFIIQIFFLFTLSRCLSSTQPRHRDMQPGMVWLNLIPCVSLVWIFFTVNRVGSSLRKEYRSRRWPLRGESFGQTVGMIYAACSVATVLAGIPVLVAAVICFVIYWVQIVGYSSKLQSQPYVDRRSDDFEDEFDDDFKPAQRPRQRYADEEIDDRYRERPSRRDFDGEPDDRYRAK